MKHRPLILITPSSEQCGAEFGDRALSLSNKYPDAVAHAGGLPWVLPLTPQLDIVDESVARADGVLLTGGDDIQPSLYRESLPAKLQRTVNTEDPLRDLIELTVIRAAFRMRKPLLAICRGHQLLNVALGGGLVVDIPTEMPHAAAHQRMADKDRPVHRVRIRPGSMLARVLGSSSARVNSTHHQAVTTPAPPLVASAVSADGIVEAMELDPQAGHLSPFLLSVQFHPERLTHRHRVFGRLFKAFVRAAGRQTLPKGGTP